MSRTSYPLRLLRSMKRAAQRLAEEDGVSLNHWIAVAVAEKIGAVETAVSFLDHRAGTTKPADLLPLLENAGEEPPPPGDEIPA